MQKAVSLCLVLLLLLCMTGCRDPEKIFLEAIQLSDTALSLLHAMRQRPERSQENKALADFLTQNLQKMEQSLAKVLAFRRKDGDAFDILFEKHRSSIVGMLSRLESIHRDERQMLRYLPLVFAPVETYRNETEMEHYRKLCVSYFEYLLEVAKSVR